MKIAKPILLAAVAGILIVACAAPTTTPIVPIVTATRISTAIADTPTPSPSPTVTLTPTPTLAPDAITEATAAQIDKALWLTENGGAVMGVAVSPDGARVAAGGLDWIVRIYDAHTGEKLARLEHHRHNINALAWSPDGQFFVSGSRDETVQIWKPDGERVLGMHTTGQITSLAYAPDSSAFASVGHYSSTGEVWQSSTGALLFTLEGHRTRLRCVAYSADSQWIASGDKAGAIVIHDAHTGQPVFWLEGSHGEDQAMAFSPDGLTLAVGTDRGRIELWDMEERSYEGTIEAHTGGVTSLVYSRDGSLLISSGGDGVIRLWDAQTDKKARSLTGHGGAVNAIALSQDGRTLVSASSDGTVIVWRVLP